MRPSLSSPSFSPFSFAVLFRNRSSALTLSPLRTAVIVVALGCSRQAALHPLPSLFCRPSISSALLKLPFPTPDSAAGPRERHLAGGKQVRPWVLVSFFLGPAGAQQPLRSAFAQPSNLRQELRQARTEAEDKVRPRLWHAAARHTRGRFLLTSPLADARLSAAGEPSNDGGAGAEDRGACAAAQRAEPPAVR